MAKKVTLTETHIFAGIVYLPGEYVVPDDFRIAKGAGKVVNDKVDNKLIAAPSQEVFKPKLDETEEAEETEDDEEEE
jgi:hypothetical protein